jgi:hypothetical protein
MLPAREDLSELLGGRDAAGQHDLFVDDEGRGLQDPVGHDPVDLVDLLDVGVEPEGGDGLVRVGGEPPTIRAARSQDADLGGRGVCLPTAER